MPSAPLTIHVFSFGYKFTGPPVDPSGNGGGFVFDCRALPNPFWDESVRAYSGIEEPVTMWLFREREVAEFAELANRLVLYTARAYANLGRERLQVAFGCTGGRHRSPYLAEQLRRTLAAEGFRVELRHVDIDREAGRFAAERK